MTLGGSAKGNRSAWQHDFRAPKGYYYYYRIHARTKQAKGTASPWNEYTCDEPGHPSVFLTWTSGTTLSRAGFASAIRHAQDRIAAVLEQGRAAERLPHQNIVVGNSGSVTITTKPYRSRLLLAPFTFGQLAEAVDLMRICGLDRRGGREEMWVEVFRGGEQRGMKRKRMGYVYLYLDFAPDGPPVAVDAADDAAVS
ncbi:MAG: hypothetical protein Q9173_001804 [Seirophora scorigena]